MLRFKSCPRCKGDMISDSDRYGLYEQCLQCGYLRDFEIALPRLEPEEEPARDKELVRVR